MNGLFEGASVAHGPMDFKVFQAFVSREILNRDHPIIYPTIAIAEEAGEISGKVKKWLRGDVKELDKLALIKEAGDVLFYLAFLAEDCGYTLEQVARINVDKIEDRKRRGVKRGNGDDR